MEETRCIHCGHAEAVHLESGPNGTPWCRLCYAHPYLHKRKDHTFES